MQAPFVGRDRELEALDTLSSRGTIWIWGPPGVGKSRLAGEWLSRRGAAPWTVDVSRCSEDDLIGELATALGVAVDRGNRDQSWATLHAAARATSRALLLDNADALRSLVQQFVQGLSGVLVTCRSAPSSDAVVSLRLEPLPDAAATALFDMVTGEMASTLSRASVARLIELLDGLPLAIVFAAHRMRLLTIDEQIARLQAGADAPMHGMVEWMWRELRPAARAVVVQCTAFVDGFSAAAIEETAATEEAVLDVLDELLRQAWVQRDQDEVGTYRFRLLHALRDFAIRRAAPEELAAARGRALNYWARRAPLLRAQVEEPGGRHALMQLEVERDNLISAAQTGLVAGDARALDVIESLRWNACFVGPTYVYADLLEQAHQLAPRCEHAAAAKFLEFAAEFARLDGRHRAAAVIAESAATRAAHSGDEALKIRCDITEAKTLARLDTALQRADTAGTELDRARALERVGRMHLATDPELADTYFRDAIDTYRAYANDLFVGEAALGRAQVLLSSGRPRDAVDRLVATVDEGVVFGALVPVARHQIALAHDAADEPEAAERMLEEARAAWSARGSTGHVPSSWVASARVYWTLGDREKAIHACRTAQRLAPAVGDDRSKALAVGLMAMFLWAEGQTRMDADLLAVLPALADDPIAAVAHLSAYIGARAGQGTPADDELARAAEIVSEIPDEHPTRPAAVQLLAVGRAFRQLCEIGRLGGASESAAARVVAQRELHAATLPGGAGLQHPRFEFYGRLLLEQAQRLVDRLDARPVLADRDAKHSVLFHANCHWIRIDDGEPIDLNSRRQLRVIMKALARQHFIDASVLLSVEELLEVGWPGEQMTASSGRSRLYTAIRDLRKMGLDALITTEDGGYRLAADVRYRVADPTGILAAD